MMRAFRVPMAVRFRGVDARTGVLVQGAHGWGEFSPFPEYPAEACGRWAAAAGEAASVAWPAAARDRIPVNVTVPAVGPTQAHALVRASGCATAKVKIAEAGQTEADDVARVEAVRDALGPAGYLRVDVNAVWDVATAARRLAALARFDLQYAEQPVATLVEMAELRRAVPVPLAVDESIRTAADPLAVASQLRPGTPHGIEAADVVVLKVQPLGGVHAALRVAEACGLPVVVSSALETSIGLAAGVALAAALPELPYACGLATARLLAGDVVAEPLADRGGYLDVRRPPVDEIALAAFQLDGPKAEAQIRRFTVAAEAGA